MQDTLNVEMEFTAEMAGRIEHVRPGDTPYDVVVLQLVAMGLAVLDAAGGLLL